VGQPFRIGVMQLTMEPLEEILEHARVMDDAGFDTIWLAEAYPWWRKHSMEARSSTALSPLLARETERLAVGWGIISPFTRHPVQIAMEARVTQEAAGPGRFYLGLGVSKIFMRHAGIGEGAKPVAAMKEAAEIIRRVLGGEEVDFAGKVFEAHVPALHDSADAPRWEVPLYFAGTGPMMLKAAAQVGDGLLTASITTPAFVRYVRERVAEAGRDPDSLDLGCTIVASIDEDRERGRDGAREIAGMYLANKVQNIQAAAEALLELAGLSQDEIRPVAEAMERGGRLAAKAAVTDEILDKCKPIAGTPEDCIAAIEEYRAAGCTHVMLELWGEDRLGQLRLFGERVLSHFH
jgi:5,10-methylenetetrahydromethanopterin reductase